MTTDTDTSSAPPPSWWIDEYERLPEFLQDWIRRNPPEKRPAYNTYIDDDGEVWSVGPLRSELPFKKGDWISTEECLPVFAVLVGDHFEEWLDGSGVVDFYPTLMRHVVDDGTYVSHFDGPMCYNPTSVDQWRVVTEKEQIQATLKSKRGRDRAKKVATPARGTIEG